MMNNRELSPESNVEKFVDDCRERLQAILSRLEWTEEGVLKNCNTNSPASTPTSASKKKVPPPTIKSYPDSLPTNSVVLTTPDLQTILQDSKVEAPQNFYDLQANFGREQKLKIYEHTIKNTKKLNNNRIIEVPEGEESLADIVAEKRREAKRKKRKFRITKPTRIEEIRSLVQLQMQALEQFRENQERKESNSKEANSRNRFIDSRDNKNWENYASHRRIHENNHSDKYKGDTKHKTYIKSSDYEKSNSRSSQTSRYKDKYEKSSTHYELNEEYKRHRRKRSASQEFYKNNEKSQKEYSSFEKHRRRSPHSNDYRDKSSNDVLDNRKRERNYDSHSSKRSRSPKPYRKYEEPRTAYEKKLSKESFYRESNRNEQPLRKRSRSLDPNTTFERKGYKDCFKDHKRDSRSPQLKGLHAPRKRERDKSPCKKKLYRDQQRSKSREKHRKKSKKHRSRSKNK